MKILRSDQSKALSSHQVRVLLILLLGALIATACATVPLGVSNRTLRTGTPNAKASACHPVTSDHVVSSIEAGRSEFLDPAEINLLIWNIHKGLDAGWLEEFAELSIGQDLLVLQEAYLRDGLRDFLLSRTLSWNLATTFMRYQIETGVMTASQVMPTSACVQRTMEPLLLLPKSTLISRYPIEGSAETLLVGNIHAVNFSLGMKTFRSQLNRLASMLDEHEGPMIVAGDFNSWNQSRSSVLDQVFVETRSMREVAFDDRSPRSIFGRPVDHVYYRGLTVVAGRVLESDHSDHDPIWVRFALSGEETL